MTLLEVRNEILGIDTEIIKLIKKRLACADKVAAAKREEGGSPVDAVQREKVLKRSYEMAKMAGIDPEMTKEIFEILIRMNEKRQTELKKR
ncbi:MAG: chorismate mutase [Methanomicrobium sp.]|jgi:chorismate mutase|uniref:chorismate mutase n=1 Tax=Methanomicrobium mobile TaxID=2205 RepID=UPI0005B2D6B0|nr:chorismate mutase [Methanomicrobium mobile]MBO7388676.1 chorismate mutase [Methanomicrobium sp.]MBP5083199.1 chorismate mutase [Methanomicrobium sp.]